MTVTSETLSSFTVGEITVNARDLRDYVNPYGQGVDGCFIETAVVENDKVISTGDFLVQRLVVSEPDTSKLGYRFECWLPGEADPIVELLPPVNIKVKQEMKMNEERKKAMVTSIMWKDVNDKVRLWVIGRK